jgi:hypothetical protein
MLQLELLRADKPVKKASVNMHVARSPGGAGAATTQVSNDENDTNVEYDVDE